MQLVKRLYFSEVRGGGVGREYETCEAEIWDTLPIRYSRLKEALDAAVVLGQSISCQATEWGDATRVLQRHLEARLCH